MSRAVPEAPAREDRQKDSPQRNYNDQTAASGREVPPATGPHRHPLRLSRGGSERRSQTPPAGGAQRRAGTGGVWPTGVGRSSSSSSPFPHPAARSARAISRSERPLRPLLRDILPCLRRSLVHSARLTPRRSLTTRHSRLTTPLSIPRLPRLVRPPPRRVQRPAQPGVALELVKAFLPRGGCSAGRPLPPARRPARGRRAPLPVRARRRGQSRSRCAAHAGRVRSDSACCGCRR